jgi:hypothetical protein
VDRPGRLLILVIAALALLVAASGCGGDDASEDVTEGLTAPELLQQSARAWEGVESFRIAFEAAGSADLGAEASRLLGNRIDLTGEGTVRPPDAAAIDATVRVTGLPVQAGLTRVGGTVVLTLLGRNIALELDPQTIALLDFRAAYPELTRWIVDPERTEGNERVGDTETVAVSGSLVPERALAALRPLLGPEAPIPDAADAVSGTATIWLGTADLFPRRITVIVRGDAGRLAAGAGALDLSITADLSDFGAAGDIVLPDIDDRLRPDQLARLIGG